MKRLTLTIIFFFIASFLAFAGEPQLDEEVKALCNKVMLNIYNEIMEAKKQYKELENFTEAALSKNQHGIYSIEYRYLMSEGAVKDQIYEFGLTIAGMQDSNFYAPGRQLFNLGFPLLKLEFIGYQKKIFRTGQFDIEGPLKKHGLLLWDYQQRFVPYKLTIEPVKEEYKVDEPIEFIVTLKNLSKKNIIVKDLNEQTLFFLYGGQPWGAQEMNSSQVKFLKGVVLKSDESISKKFQGNAFSSPQEFEIHCTYGFAYEGVQPSATLKIRVVQ